MESDSRLLINEILGNIKVPKQIVNLVDEILVIARYFRHIFILIIVEEMQISWLAIVLRKVMHPMVRIFFIIIINISFLSIK